MSFISKDKLFTVFGVFCLFYWSLDAANNVFSYHEPSWSLWYSSVGMALSAIALLKRNTLLLNSLFCALFIIESIWSIGYFSHILLHKSFMGVTDYLFQPTYPTRDLLITSYHVLIVPTLFIGVLREKTVYKNAWIGALLFASTLAAITYFFVAQTEEVNCIHLLNYCQNFAAPLATIDNPLRTELGIVLITVLLYIPTNGLLWFAGRKLGWKEKTLKIPERLRTFIHVPFLPRFKDQEA